MLDQFLSASIPAIVIEEGIACITTSIKRSIIIRLNMLYTESTTCVVVSLIDAISDSGCEQTAARASSSTTDGRARTGYTRAESWFEPIIIDFH